VTPRSALPVHHCRTNSDGQYRSRNCSRRQAFYRGALAARWPAKIATKIGYPVVLKQDASLTRAMPVASSQISMAIS
jgi:hypothetical protein